MHRSIIPAIATALAATLAAASHAADRDVQIRSINLDTGVVEFFNFGTTDEPLDGWRFCTHDEDEFRRYSAVGGFNGVTVEAGTAFFVHFNDDAPAGPDHINRTTLGGFFATPLDAGPYGMQIYVNSGFIDGNNIADHLQWSIDGIDNLTADERSDEAEAGGVWTNQSLWIATSAQTNRIRLTDGSGGVLHSPDDYVAPVVGAPLANPIPTAIPAGSVIVRLEELSTGLTAPNWGISAPGQPGRLVVSDQDGILWTIDVITGTKSEFLDLSANLIPLGVFGPGSFDERGLLGVAFHPGYTANGNLYTYTSEPVGGNVADFTTLTGAQVADHHATITEWTVPDPTNPASVVDPGSANVLLRVAEPQFNHNAGAISFGPDDMLYVTLGDGGGADDRDGQDFLGANIVGHDLTGNGQNGENILGSVIRIDVNGNDSANGQYGIPADNPFLGADPRLDEIFAYGFRNPFRASFDALTGDFYVADVGQNHVEEVNVVTSGGNYGWNHKEGTFFFDHNDNDDGFVTDVDPGTVPTGLVDPIAQYDHDEGLAIVGGFVYRGSKIPALQGRYVFGEFAQNFANDGRLFYLDAANEVQEFQLVGQAALNLSLLGFGQDASGEVYVLANATGTPFDTTGVVLRIESSCPADINNDGEVDTDDFLAVLGGWGNCPIPCPPSCAADTNLDCVVNTDDFLAVLGGWGSCVAPAPTKPADINSSASFTTIE